MENTSKQTGLLGLLFLSLFIFISTSVCAQTNTKQEHTYIMVEVKGLACTFCAYGLEKKLKKMEGVNKVEIDIKKGFAFISSSGNQKPSKESLKKIITDSGFTVGNINYSGKPFVKKENMEK